MAGVLQALRVYPVKACGGFALEASEVDRLGLRLDRAFVVVDAPSGRFVTQREEPRLALVATRLDGATLELATRAAGSIRIDLACEDGPRRAIVVWRHAGEGVDQGDLAAAWLSDFLGRPLRLVRTPPDHARRVSPERVPDPAWISFSDGYPFLVLSQASLDVLNARLAAPLPIDRFRPNLVIAGVGAHAEDGWRRIRIGEIELEMVKPCDRCAVTTVDQETGVPDGEEPLRTLALYRRSGGSVVFGQNAVHRGTGRLAVGTAVEVLDVREERSLRLDPVG